MNSLTEPLTATYEPILAIVVYHKKQGDQYYLESHPIEKGLMMAGKPFDEETIADLVSYYSSEMATRDEIKGAIPEELLYCEWNSTQKILMWYNTPQERMMHFTNDLHIKSGTAKQPGLIYLVKNGKMSVLAVKAKSRPKANDILYRPPYHNCSEDGTVCTGSARVAKPKTLTYKSMIEYYEKIFWGSEFSHLAQHNSSINGNVNTLWKTAIRKKTEFDTAVLKPAKPKMNLSSLIKSIS